MIRKDPATSAQERTTCRQQRLQHFVHAAMHSPDFRAAPSGRVRHDGVTGAPARRRDFGRNFGRDSTGGTHLHGRRDASGRAGRRALRAEEWMTPGVRRCRAAARKTQRGVRAAALCALPFSSCPANNLHPSRTRHRPSPPATALAPSRRADRPSSAAAR